MSQPLREFTTLQKAFRIGLNKDFREELGWEEGDQLLIEVYRGRLIVENLTKGLLPIGKRVND